MDEKLEQRVREAVEQSPRSFLEAAKRAGIPYTTFVRYAKKLNLYQLAKERTNAETEARIKAAVAESPASMLRAAKIAGIPYATFIRYAKQLNIYEPNQSGQGQRKVRVKPGNHETPLDENLELRVREAVAQSPRSFSTAAKQAGIPYTTFVRYAKKLNLYQQTQERINTGIVTAIRSAIAESPTSMLRAAQIANIPYSTFIRYAKQLGIYAPNQSGQRQRKF